MYFLPKITFLFRKTTFLLLKITFLLRKITRKLIFLQHKDYKFRYYLHKIIRERGLLLSSGANDYLIESEQGLHRDARLRRATGSRVFADSQTSLSVAYFFTSFCLPSTIVCLPIRKFISLSISPFSFGSYCKKKKIKWYRKSFAVRRSIDEEIVG